MFIDTHCHLEKSFYDDIEKVIEDNKENGIQKMVVSGCNKSEIEEVLDYAEKYDCVYLTIGFHPDTCRDVLPEDLKWLKEVVLSSSKIVGIGEIGLDYHYGKEDVELQKELFEKQLELAQSLNLPVVIHSRDATKDTIEILQKYKVKGVIHCFSGSLETAKIYIKMGYFLGIGGVVTFKNSKLGEVLKGLSLKNIVLETDSPYLAPVPHRGETNSSKYIPLIAEKIGDIYDVSIHDVARVTSDNVSQVFDFCKYESE